jgi:hypothetical protein
MMFGHVLIWWHATIESSSCNRKACYISEAHTLAQTVAGEFAPPESSSLSQFASVGGGHSGNLERDLHTWTRHAFNMNLDVSYVDIDLWDVHTWTEVRVRQPVLLPVDIVCEAWQAGHSFPRIHSDCLTLCWGHWPLDMTTSSITCNSCSSAGGNMEDAHAHVVPPQ